MEKEMKMKKGELLGKVLVLATNAHAGQFDKGGKPYILHPLAVMALLNSDDEELQCIALLHDVIEDTKTTWAQLKELGCTDRIIDAVDALTKMPGQSYDEYKEEVFSNKDAMVVKMADLRHNTDIRRLKGVSQKDIDRLAKYNLFFLELQSRM
jgi:(p)ppGpp synthase/HD superfamily hydrolase